MTGRRIGFSAWQLQHPPESHKLRVYALFQHPSLSYSSELLHVALNSCPPRALARKQNNTRCVQHRHRTARLNESSLFLSFQSSHLCLLPAEPPIHRKRSVQSRTMTPTVLTCGKLRLTVPHGATLPSVNMTSSGAVELAFETFTGVVTFEALPFEQNHPLPTPPIRASPAPASQQPVPRLASQLIHQFSSSHNFSQPHPASNLVPPVSTEPLSSQPLPSQPIPSQSLSTPPLHAHPSDPSDPSSLSALTNSLSQDILPFNAFPSAQVPDSHTDSQLRPNETPPIPHFTNLHTTYLALSPPSSQDSDQPPLTPENPKPPPEKRPAPAKVEYRASKQGKRVRFEENPVILQSPSKPPALAHKQPVPWQPVHLSDPEKTPRRRWGSTFTRLQASGSVILLGGESEAEGFLQQMSIFDADKRVWLQDGNDTPDMPGSGRAWHTTTSLDLSLFVFGGEKEIDGERTQTNDVLMYDTTYYTWYPPALSGQPPIPRAGHCAAVIPESKNIVIYGGINGNKWLNDMHVLEELNSWSKVRMSTKSTRPTARSYASLTPASGFLVLFGGNNKTRCFSDVHLLTTDLTWIEPVILGRSPKPRTGHCAIPSRDGKKVIVYGGWDDQGAQRLFYSDVWELNIKSQTECQWKCLFAGDNSSKTPGPRAGAALCSVTEEQDEMLLFGGWYQLSYFNDLYKLMLPNEKRSPGGMACGS